MASNSASMSGCSDDDMGAWSSSTLSVRLKPPNTVRRVAEGGGCAGFRSAVVMVGAIELLCMDIEAELSRLRSLALTVCCGGGSLCWMTQVPDPDSGASSESADAPSMRRLLPEGWLPDMSPPHRSDSSGLANMAPHSWVVPPPPRASPPPSAAPAPLLSLAATAGLTMATSGRASSLCAELARLRSSSWRSTSRPGWVGGVGSTSDARRYTSSWLDCSLPGC
mmetsp:Transcript_12311/g.37057  ORF Transcript_12311/g.37057 Transcript_12311/m.37057 type:complete len:223 (-) Transcript_12311:343-1011(-)